jgi:hypothetical protein
MSFGGNVAAAVSRWSLQLEIPRANRPPSCQPLAGGAVGDKGGGEPSDTVEKHA